MNHYFLVFCYHNPSSPSTPPSFTHTLHSHSSAFRSRSIPFVHTGRELALMLRKSESKSAQHEYHATAQPPRFSIGEWFLPTKSITHHSTYSIPGTHAQCHATHALIPRSFPTHNAPLPILRLRLPLLSLCLFIACHSPELSQVKRHTVTAIVHPALPLTTLIALMVTEYCTTHTHTRYTVPTNAISSHALQWQCRSYSV